MFNKPSEQFNVSALSVNAELWNKIVKIEPFFARGKRKPKIGGR
jgi:hypothetical protein